MLEFVVINVVLLHVFAYCCCSSRNLGRALFVRAGHERRLEEASPLPSLMEGNG